MLLRTLPILALLFFAACSTMQVQSDYDPAFDFKTLSTFAVVYPEKKAETLTQTRIADSVKEEMLRKGYTAADRSTADFVILFHTDVTRRQQVVTDYQMVGFYPYYGYGFGAAMAVPVQREYSYDEGKIIIDALRPGNNRIFWRAVATDRLKTFETPQERIAYIRETVGAILKSFPKKQ